MKAETGAARAVQETASDANQSSGWLSRHTRIAGTAHAILDAPPLSGLDAWARTTAGVVVVLTLLQITTGVLLAFFYVPAAESAHTTVAFIEKSLPAGSWIRALHEHGSKWLVVALVLHLAQRLLMRGGWRRKPFGWIASVVLLALMLANGATGYSLPWDARAFYSTRVAASIAGGLPLVGPSARAWLLGGADLSTLTVSRFYALHVLLIPILILLTVVARLFVFREPPNAIPDNETDITKATAAITHDTQARDERAPDPHVPDARARGWMRAQLARNALAAGLVFIALALYAAKFPAPLGPPPEAAAQGYLPRPGAQFLWLFQLLKYLPGAAASLAALLLPLLLLGGLAALPLIQASRFARLTNHPRRNAGVVLFTLGVTLVALFTTLAYVEDARDPHTRKQLARQAQEEHAFRQTPFAPRRLRADDDTETTAPRNTTDDGATSSSPSNAPPAAYAKNCAKCHGANGEGKFANPSLVGITSQPRRTVEDLIAIQNNPAAYGLEARMPSFARKLSEDEKRAIAEWIASLKL
ncbi:MAG TPA: cytochrome b N-terminal domain-containing protein [Pyrinomonadaceae bacterium]|jgi:ubiquinol-cytochrome c reductase cytochrome b subunit|nr:cytochrome b N-terminal domain-containing protein [Pyrinomonadaceae bacterium]